MSLPTECDPKDARLPPGKAQKMEDKVYCTEGPITYICCNWCCQPFTFEGDKSCCGMCGFPKWVTLTCLAPLWVIFCCGRVRKDGVVDCCCVKE